jgi:hypothetical protein
VLPARPALNFPSTNALIPTPVVILLYYLSLTFNFTFRSQHRHKEHAFIQLHCTSKWNWKWDSYIDRLIVRHIPRLPSDLQWQRISRFNLNCAETATMWIQCCMIQGFLTWVDFIISQFKLRTGHGDLEGNVNLMHWLMLDWKKWRLIYYIVLSSTMRNLTNS